MCAARPPTTPAVPALDLPYLKQTPSASQTEAQNPELGHRTTHVVTIELMTGSLGRRPRWLNPAQPRPARSWSAWLTLGRASVPDDFPGDPVNGPLITMPGHDRPWQVAHLQLSRASSHRRPGQNRHDQAAGPIIRTHPNEPDRGPGNEAAQQARRSGTADLDDNRVPGQVVMAVPERLVMVGSPPRPGSPPATPRSGDPASRTSPGRQIRREGRARHRRPGALIPL